MEAPEKIDPPTAIAEWTLSQIQAALIRPLPVSLLATRRQSRRTIYYVPWQTVNVILDKYAPGWTWEVRSISLSSDRLFVVGRLTISTAEGLFYREATGTELLKEQRVMRDSEGEVIRDTIDRPLVEPFELAHGNPSSNAEAQAFSSAAAKFGLGLYLEDKS